MEAKIPISSVIGLTGCALLLVNVMMMATCARRYSLTSRRLLFFVVCAVAFVPVKGLAVAGYLRGVIGDLSLTTLILLVMTGISYLSDKDTYSPRSLFVLMLFVLAGGLFLYPFALGLSYFNPYTLGYGSKAFIAVLFLLSLASWYFECYLLAWCITVAVGAFMMDVYESTNLWDYFIDPLVTFYAVSWLLVKGVTWLFHHSSSRVQYPAT